MRKFVMISLLFVTGLLACKKDKKNDPEPTPQTPVATGGLKINFKNKVDSLPLVFGQYYLNALGDSFKVSKFNYFISNIAIVKTDNSVYFEPESYHLVKHASPATCLVTLANVPPGAYKSISFMLGVDSARNVSGAQTGDLDRVTASDMYWDWTSGYITLKFEGSAPESGSPDKSLTYHLGGYGGSNKPQRMFNIGFGAVTADVSIGVTPVVQLRANVAELFKTPNSIQVSTDYSQVLPGPGVKKYADNYADMFSFEQIQN